LVALEHAVAERVLLGQVKIRLNLQWFHIREGRVRSYLGTVHSALSGYGVEIAHLHKSGVRMAEIVVYTEADWAQRDDLASGVDAALDDVGPSRDQNRILKQIVGRGPAVANTVPSTVGGQVRACSFVKAIIATATLRGA
jgi:hypothetical protein